jgi:hypothetical protein
MSMNKYKQVICGWVVSICMLLALWGGMVYNPYNTSTWQSHEYQYNFDTKTGRGDWTLQPNNRTIYYNRGGNHGNKEEGTNQRSKVGKNR